MIMIIIVVIITLCYYAYFCRSRPYRRSEAGSRFFFISRHPWGPLPTLASLPRWAASVGRDARASEKGTLPRAKTGVKGF